MRATSELLETAKSNVRIARGKLFVIRSGARQFNEYSFLEIEQLLRHVETDINESLFQIRESGRERV